MTVSLMMSFLLQKWWPEQTMYDIQLHSFEFCLFYLFDNWETADVAL